MKDYLTLLVYCYFIRKSLNVSGIDAIKKMYLEIEKLVGRISVPMNRLCFINEIL